MEKAKSRTCSCEKHFCFYNSIMYAFGDLSPAPSFWATPLGMKKFLKIGETDEIEIKHVALLEPKMKVCVSVVGDENYVSDATYPKKITLTLRDGHYSYFSKKTELTKVWVQGLKYVLFRKIDDHFLTYDGNELVADYDLALEDLASSKDITYKRFNELTEEQTEKLDSLKIEEQADEYEELIGEYMVTAYEEFIKNCQHLKEISNGAVDIAANGYNIKDTALSIFSRYSKAYDVQPIDDEEYSILSSIKNYGILYAKPATIKGRCIDGNSWYCSIMKDPKLYVPLGNPEYKTLLEIDEKVPYGLYRADIIGHDERLFLINPKKWYTYIDIKEALHRGYAVSLVCDGNCNHVYYSSQNRETGHYLFRGFVDLLYSLKKKNPLVKRILNMLWGALCQRVKYYEDGKECEEVDLGNDFSFLDTAEDTDSIDAFIKSKQYKLGWARCGVFITAMGRKKLADYIEDIVDDVYRIHTDGFYTTSMKQFNLTAELGGFKIEDEGTFTIESINKIVKRF